MRSRLATILGVLGLAVVTLLYQSCTSSPPQCSVCGTTVNGAYAIIDTIPVVEHNNTGEPGGPFASFDISWTDPVNHLMYVTDRIGIAIVQIDTVRDIPGPLAVIGGINMVSNGGNNASPCWAAGSTATPTATVTIPPLLSALGNFTRYGCRTLGFTIPGFGANNFLGGYPGAQCCASRGNSLNPLAGPNGIQVTADGKTAFVGNGSSSLMVFDLTTNPATVIGDIPTGQGPDYDGQSMPNPGTANNGGIAPCGASANGRAFSDITCGDLRGDELSYGVVGPAGMACSQTVSIIPAPCRGLVLVTNGDPGFPFATVVDVTDIVNRTNVAPFVTAGGGGHCLPAVPANPYGPTNFPTCIIGQIYYDGASTVSSATIDDNQPGFPCPDPSLAFVGGAAVPSGVSGPGGGTNAPCHHGPILNQNTGVQDTFGGTLSGTAAAGEGGAIGVAGLGGSTFNPIHGTFFMSNSNSTVSGSATQASTAVGSIDEIDPRIGNPNGPVVIHSYPMINCMPTAIVQGPGTDFLVGCADHDGTAFPPKSIIINGATGAILANIDQTGSVDEIWFNPGDNRYYLAARDFPGGPQLGVIDAGARQWLVNFPTNNNSHAVSVDFTNNHIFVPSQTGAACQSQNNQGCVLVIARQ
jgi:hypothetical protein